MTDAVSTKPNRLDGLDFARFLAFAGMVLVNFHVVTGDLGGAFWAEVLLLALQGKAAATFVVLAGIGLGMGAARTASVGFGRAIVKRALFLFILGLINTLMFPADILHYYAIYFLLGLFFIRASSRVLGLVAMALPFVFVLLLFFVDYDAGWNWETLEYSGFWTVDGFVRNLMFNGWHPVVPWLSFLLVGFILARLDLRRAPTHRVFVSVGAAMLLIAYSAATLIRIVLPAKWGDLVSTSPIPPMPQYMLAGTGAALLVIGGSLALFRQDWSRVLRVFALTGRQALTLYIAHVLVGMGALEALGLLGGQPAEISVFASLFFIAASVLYVVIWASFFKAGPIEWLMRRISG